MSVAEADAGRGRARAGRARFRLSRSGWVGAAIVLVYVLVALTGPLWAPYEAAKILTGNPFDGASLQHPFGTDNLGRDVFTRVLYAARVDLQIGAIGVAFPLVIGAVVGILAGFFGGWTDAVIGRIIDVVIAFPFLVLGFSV